MKPSSLAQRYAQIQEILKQAQHSVTCIAVSKFQSAEQVRELYELGHRDFGENYVQELLTKQKQLTDWGCDEIRWHFIGHLQTNKARSLIPFIAAIHSVDSVRLIKELAHQCKKLNRPESLPIFIEVNINQQQSKAGIAPDNLNILLAALQIHPELTLQGLMCIPNPEQDPRPAFIQLRKLSQNLDLSMGMSSDFEIAIEEGATHVRIGTALFGPRKTLL